MQQKQASRSQLNAAAFRSSAERAVFSGQREACSVPYSDGDDASTDADKSSERFASPLMIARHDISLPFRNPFFVTLTPSGEIAAMYACPSISSSLLRTLSSLVAIKFLASQGSLHAYSPVTCQSRNNQIRWIG